MFHHVMKYGRTGATTYSDDTAAMTAMAATAATATVMAVAVVMIGQDKSAHKRMV